MPALPWSHSRRPVTRPELSTRSIVKVKKARTAVPVRVRTRYDRPNSIVIATDMANTS